MRARKRRRSKNSVSSDVTSRCQISGREEAAISPRTSGRIGTGRQVSTSMSCSKSAASISARWALSSCGRKRTATPRGLLSSSERPHCAQEPLARNGGGDADAVARFAVGGDGAAMLEAGESAKRVLENLVRRFGGKLGDEAYAAGIEIESRIDQAAVNIGGRRCGSNRGGDGA